MMGLGSTYIPLNFESDPDHQLDTKKIKDPDFPFTWYYDKYLKSKVIHALAEVCTLQVLLYYIWFYRHCKTLMTKRKNDMGNNLP